MCHEFASRRPDFQQHFIVLFLVGGLKCFEVESSRLLTEDDKEEEKTSYEKVLIVCQSADFF